jgi:hypothetical protein
LKRTLLVCGMGSGLAACGGNSGDASAPAPPPPVVVMPQENQFGAAFATDYRASPMSNPVTPVPGDIIPLSLTTNPVPVG